MLKANFEDHHVNITNENQYTTMSNLSITNFKIIKGTKLIIIFYYNKTGLFVLTLGKRIDRFLISFAN